MRFVGADRLRVISQGRGPLWVLESTDEQAIALSRTKVIKLMKNMGKNMIGSSPAPANDVRDGRWINKIFPSFSTWKEFGGQREDRIIAFTLIYF